ncbi:hypothetical protein CYY_003734 [Polysphondylium violaceum]|uniref:CBS domain-containing protein n=1 Tax=Polysphondylium violaceum TaxID=133409 RepID=A0A8J4PVT5_9MYCE|nr:hypothetical protein CYY_003734 [Polysphondylium violaceum]
MLTIKNIFTKSTIRLPILVNQVGLCNLNNPMILGSTTNTTTYNNEHSNKMLMSMVEHKRNNITISPKSVEIIRVKSQIVDQLHPKFNKYKDINVGGIIDKKIASNHGKMVKITETSSVFDAIKLMNEKRVGACIVVDSTSRMSGIFSERDYLSKVDLCGLDPKQTLVKEVMSPKVITVSSDSGANKCISIMTKRNIRHLPVVENNRLIGMLSIGDLVKYVISEQEDELSNLRHDISTNRGNDKSNI